MIFMAGEKGNRTLLDTKTNHSFED